MPKYGNDRIDRAEGHRVPRKILLALHEIRRTATMENASFGFPDDRLRVVRENFSTEIPSDIHPTDYIKEQTRLWRNSWIESPLDTIIAWAEGKSV